RARRSQRTNSSSRSPGWVTQLTSLAACAIVQESNSKGFRPYFFYALHFQLVGGARGAQRPRGREEVRHALLYYPSDLSSFSAERSLRKKPPRRSSSSSIDSPGRVPAVSGSQGSGSSGTLKQYSLALPDRRGC